MRPQGGSATDYTYRAHRRTLLKDFGLVDPLDGSAAEEEEEEQVGHNKRAPDQQGDVHTADTFLS